MKRLTLGFAALAALLINPAFAVGTAHDHHHVGQSVTLQLNAGTKWQTDAPLRRSMAEIRPSVAANLHAIHEDRLPAESYRMLARTIEEAVATIIAQCKLPPAADAQLHLIVAELMAGAQLMSSTADSGEARSGAIRVVEALNNYAAYFDDPDFRSLEH